MVTTELSPNREITPEEEASTFLADVYDQLGDIGTRFRQLKRIREFHMKRWSLYRRRWYNMIGNSMILVKNWSWWYNLYQELHRRVKLEDEVNQIRQDSKIATIMYQILSWNLAIGRLELVLRRTCSRILRFQCLKEWIYIVRLLVWKDFSGSVIIMMLKNWNWSRLALIVKLWVGSIGKLIVDTLRIGFSLNQAWCWDFGNLKIRGPSQSLFCIKQTGSIAEYVQKFEDLSSQVTWLDDQKQEGIFLNGLTQEM